VIDPTNPSKVAPDAAPDLGSLDPQLRFVIRAMLANRHTRPDHILILADAIEELARDGPPGVSAVIRIQWMAGLLRAAAVLRTRFKPLPPTM
jgi:hypothetical protein